eukprot:303482_1
MINANTQYHESSSSDEIEDLDSNDSRIAKYVYSTSDNKNNDQDNNNNDTNSSNESSEEEIQFLSKKIMRELIIDGYIRKIEQLLSCRKGVNNIIPININHICYLFYVNPTIIYISNISKNQFDTFEKLTIHALNVSNMHNP